MNVRTRDNVVHGMHALEAVRDVLLQEKAGRSLTSIFGKNGEEQHAGNGAVSSNGAGAPAA